MLPIRLTLLHEPTAQEALEQILKHTTLISTSELLSFDYFTRIFCPCGRHTYGDLEVEQFTKERYVPDAYVTNVNYWFEFKKRTLTERQVRYTKHAGRASVVCQNCTCTSAPGHHRVLDLTRPFISTAPDQYQLPLRPLWQGAPFCQRFMTTFHDMGTHYLIERTDNLWVYVHTRDCNATPGYRCDNATSVYWSGTFDVVWNQHMTQVVRQAFWKTWIGRADDFSEQQAINYYGVNAIKPTVTVDDDDE